MNNLSKEKLDAIMGELSAEDKKILEAHLKGGGKAKREGEVALLAKYPHMVEGSLRYNETARKQEVDITCSQPGCDEGRTVFTSDLFQIKFCAAHAKEAAKAKKEAKAAKVKEILAKAGLK